MVRRAERSAAGRHRARAGAAALLILLGAAPAERAIVFKDSAGKETRLTLSEMLAVSPAVEISARDDEYGGRKKRYRAFLFAPVLERALKKKAFGDDEAMLRALDGYVVSMRAQKLVDDKAYIAFDDVDVPGFEPVGPKRTSPAPFYLVWAKDEQHDLVAYPRPYQLASVALESFDARFPHTRPAGFAAGTPEMQGFLIFKGVCVHCHAVNREGGRVGPELNVPKNVTEYWPEAQIRAYVKDPRSLRYGNMPPNPQLSEVDLDHVMAYLRAMAKQKHDTGAP